MKKPTISSKQVKKQIDEAYATNNWQLLEPFLLPGELERLSLPDREKLAEVFYMRGEEQIKTCEDADQMERFFNSFEMAIKLDPTLVKAWLTLAQGYLTLGLHQDNAEHAVRANELFRHTELLLQMQEQKMSADALWDWGTCLYFIAKDSEEPMDFKQAIDKFQAAEAAGLENPSFILDYGIALGEFGVCTGQKELIVAATVLIEKSIKANGDNGSAWLQLACANKILYFISNDVAYFEKADESFLAAARFNADQVTLWLNWGQLLSMEGKIVRDEELLQSAYEKLEKAERLMPNEALVLCTLADTLIHLGAITDQIELLKEAQEKLSLAYSVDPAYTDSLCLWGHCLIHMGKYFSDPLYVNRALEKFQLGISHNKKSAPFWHGLATAHFTLGELKADVTEFENAAKLSAEAVRFGGDNPGYWNDWGVALMKLGEMTQESQPIAAAVEKFEYAIRLFHRKHPGSPDPDWVYNYACSLDYLGDAESSPHFYERAIAILSHLLDQYPDFHHVRYNLALSLYHLGDAVGETEILEKSIAQFEILVKRDPEDDGLLNDLGLTYLTLGAIYRDSVDNKHSIEAFQNAEKIFLQALALGGVEANYWLGNLYALQENYSDALQFFERAKIHSALPSLNEILDNEWLTSLRQTPRFRAFLAELSEED